MTDTNEGSVIELPPKIDSTRLAVFLSAHGYGGDEMLSTSPILPISAREWAMDWLSTTPDDEGERRYYCTVHIDFKSAKIKELVSKARLKEAGDEYGAVVDFRDELFVNRRDFEFARSIVAARVADGHAELAKTLTGEVRGLIDDQRFNDAAMIASRYLERSSWIPDLYFAINDEQKIREIAGVQTEMLKIKKTAFKHEKTIKAALA